MDLTVAREEQQQKKQNQDEECSVVVAVHIRPLIVDEVQQGCENSIYISPNSQKEIYLGCGKPEHSFLYDHVFGSQGAQNPDRIYEQCVEPLVDGLFKGYNATVFAYGQTGSGKTYTMGSAFTPGQQKRGVIPNVLDTIFERIASGSTKTEFSLRCSFVEIHKEDIRDLLVIDTGSRPNIQIREVPGSAVCLAGATEKVVSCKEEMYNLLEQGTLCRATAATGMNQHSSRSHAIFTITVEQKTNVENTTISKVENENENEDEDNDQDNQAEIDTYLCAKIHLVDLAGSERTKRTKAVGQRFEEAKAINKGLLALGNVINKLVDGASHVGYRDSKLTRLLQDSLGGNSRTVMIACVSPADINYDETLNTLRYANRARNIKNKPIVNRDPQAAQIAFLRQKLAAAQAEIVQIKSVMQSEGGDSSNYLLIQQQLAQQQALGAYQSQALTQLKELCAKQEKELNALRVEMDDIRQQLTHEQKDRVQYQLQRDLLVEKVQSWVQLQDAQNSTTNAAQLLTYLQSELNHHSSTENVDFSQSLQKQYVNKIDELNQQIRKLKNINRASGQYIGAQRRSSLQMTPSAKSPLMFRNSQRLGGSQQANFEEFGRQSSQDEYQENRNQSNLPGFGNGVGVGVNNQEGSFKRKTTQESEHEDEDESDSEEDEEIINKKAEYKKMQSEYSQIEQTMVYKETQLKQIMSQAQQFQNWSSIKAQYDKKLQDVEGERNRLLSERIALLKRAQELQQSSTVDRKQIEKQYKEKLESMDEKLRDLKVKEREFRKLFKLKEKAEITCDKLQQDLQKLKHSKVQLSRKIDDQQKQFHDWKKTRDKEVIQLRKQGNKAAVQLNKLQQERQKQQMVLQRKTQEAEQARKKLQEFQNRAQPSHHANSRSRDLSGASRRRLHDTSNDNNLQGTQVLKFKDENSCVNWVEQELEFENKYYQYKRIMEGELAQRTELNRQINEIEAQKSEIDHQVNTQADAMSQKQIQDIQEHMYLLKDKKMDILKNIEERSRQIHDLQREMRQLEDEESKGTGQSLDSNRWSSLQNIQDAKQILKTVFKYASGAKAQTYELQGESTELRDEIEYLKIKLEQEKQFKEDAQKEAACATELSEQLQQYTRDYSQSDDVSQFPGENSNQRKSNNIQQLSKNNKTMSEDSNQGPFLNSKNSLQAQNSRQQDQLERGSGMRGTDTDGQSQKGMLPTIQEYKNAVDSSKDIISSKTYMNLDKDINSLITELNGFPKGRSAGDKDVQQAPQQQSTGQEQQQQQQSKQIEMSSYKTPPPVNRSQAKQNQGDFDGLANNPLYNQKNNSIEGLRSINSSEKGIINNTNLQKNQQQQLLGDRNVASEHKIQQRTSMPFDRNHMNTNIKKQQQQQQLEMQQQQRPQEQQLELQRSKTLQDYIVQNFETQPQPNKNNSQQQSDQRSVAQTQQWQLQQKKQQQLQQQTAFIDSDKFNKKAQNVDELIKQQIQLEEELSALDQQKNDKKSRVQRKMNEEVHHRHTIDLNQEDRSHSMTDVYQRLHEDPVSQSTSNLSELQKGQEQSALNEVNSFLLQNGKKPTGKLTVPIMKYYLSNQHINSHPWRDSTGKKRADYIDDIGQVISQQKQGQGRKNSKQRQQQQSSASDVSDSELDDIKLYDPRHNSKVQSYYLNTIKQQQQTNQFPKPQKSSPFQQQKPYQDDQQSDGSNMDVDYIDLVTPPPSKYQQGGAAGNVTGHENQNGHERQQQLYYQQQQQQYQQQNKNQESLQYTQQGPWYQTSNKQLYYSPENRKGSQVNRGQNPNLRDGLNHDPQYNYGNINHSPETVKRVQKLTESMQKEQMQFKNPRAGASISMQQNGHH